MRTPLLLLALLVPVWAVAEQMPTDVELKTAYCVRVKQTRLTSINSALANEPAGSTGRDLAERLQPRETNDLHRLHSYLVPKLKMLDTSALMAAANRAEADMNQVSIAAGQCMNRCDAFDILNPKWVPCMDKCDAETPAVARVRSCDKIDWLPF